MLDAWLNRFGDTYLRVLGTAVEWVGHHARLVLIAVFLLTGAAAWYAATHFSMNTNMASLISKQLAFQREHQRLVKAFPQLTDTIVAVVDGQTPGLAAQASDKLARWARKQTTDYQSVFQPGGGAYFRHTALLYLSPQQLRDLSNRLARAQPLIASLSANPTLPGLFDLLDRALRRRAQGGQTVPGLDQALAEIADSVQATAEGRFRAVDWQALMSGTSRTFQTARRFVIIKPRFNYQSIQPAAEPIARLRQAVRDMQLTGTHGVRVRLTGSAVLDNEQLQAVSKGVGVSFVLSLALVLILLVAGLRSWRHVVASLITLVVGLIWTTAFGLLTVGSFNLLSVAFAVLFVGLGVDFSIQFCMRHKEVSLSAAPRGALKQTALGIGGALTLAAAAAAASFYSVVPTSYSGLIDLGLISGTSMFIALLNSLFLLPALLAALGARHVRRPRREYHPFARFRLHRYARSITGASVLVGIIALPFMLGIRFDFNPLNLQNPRSEAVSTLRDLMRSGRFSPYSMDVLEPSLHAARAAAGRLDRLGSVSTTITLNSFVPTDQQLKLPIIQNMALIIPPFSLMPATPPPPPAPALAAAMTKLLSTLRAADRKTPAGARLQKALTQFERRFGKQAAALSTLQDRLIGALPYELRQLRQALQARPVTLADLPTSLAARYVGPHGLARIEVYPSLDMSSNRNMRRFVDEVHSVAPEATGTPALVVDGGDVVVRAFEESTIIAAVLIALLLWVVLRRFLDVLLVLSPLPLAAVLTAATMRLAGLSFNLSNIIVLPLLIGLGVAYGIYFVVRWREGVDPMSVMRSSTPEAILFSALTTVASFGSLAVANSVAMKALGETLSIALGYVLLTSLVVLPALLTVIHHPRDTGNRKELS